MDVFSNNEAPSGALSDITVLELGSMLAGPFVGSMLADFGAYVIKVEKPGKPDALREWPPHKDGESLWWKSMARNKHLVTLDISRAGGRDLVLDMLEKVDVVVENFKPGTLERWGLSPEELKEKFPKLIWVRVSGYGQSGPLSKQGGYATVAEGFSGLASFTGFPDKGPSVSAFPMGDYLAGVFGAFGALAALHHCDRTGAGQVVDVSIFEPMFRIIESVVLRYDQTGQKKPLLGNQMEEDVPRNIYRTKDNGYIAISCGSQRIYENLTRAMNRPDLVSDARFLTMADRVENRTVIDKEVADWIVNHNIDEAMLLLDEHGVVSGPVMGIEDVFSDAHFAAREAISTIMDFDETPLKMPAPVPKLSGSPGSIQWAGRKVGSANEYVFEKVFGIKSSALKKLKESGVI